MVSHFPYVDLSTPTPSPLPSRSPSPTPTYSSQYSSPTLPSPSPALSRSPSPAPSSTFPSAPLPGISSRRNARWIHAGIIKNVYGQTLQVFYAFSKVHKYGPFKGKRCLMWANDTYGTPFGNWGVGQIWRNMITFDEHHQRHWVNYLDAYGTWKHRCARRGRAAQHAYLKKIWLDRNFVDPYPQGRAVAIGAPLNVVRSPDEIANEPYRAHRPDINGPRYPGTRILLTPSGIEINRYKDWDPDAMRVIKEFLQGRMFCRDREQQSGWERTLLVQVESAFFEVGWRIDRAALRETMHAIRDRQARNAFECDAWEDYPPLMVDPIRGVALQAFMDRIKQGLDNEEEELDTDNELDTSNRGGSNSDDSDYDDDGGGGGGNRSGSCGRTGWPCEVNLSNFINLADSDVEERDGDAYIIGDGGSDEDNLFVDQVRESQKETSNQNKANGKGVKCKKKNKSKGPEKNGQDERGNEKTTKIGKTDKSESTQSEKGKQPEIGLDFEDEVQNLHPNWNQYPDNSQNNVSVANSAAQATQRDRNQYAERVAEVINIKNENDEVYTEAQIQAIFGAQTGVNSSNSGLGVIATANRSNSIEPLNITDLTAGDEENEGFHLDSSSASNPSPTILRELRERHYIMQQKQKASKFSIPGAPTKPTTSSQAISNLFSHFDKYQAEEAQALISTLASSSKNSSSLLGIPRIIRRSAEPSNTARMTLEIPPEQEPDAAALAPKGNSSTLYNGITVVAGWQEASVESPSKAAVHKTEAVLSPPTFTSSKRPRVESESNEGERNSKIKVEDNQTPVIIKFENGKEICIIDDEELRQVQHIRLISMKPLHCDSPFSETGGIHRSTTWKIT
ncbi:hypothetical protein BGZ60DRAFT_513245 [Tricladium varicosporioides]|nr:hypothetical protein BGZ60DRAFT_513245 [Hymenoscyphus varicosporioides]